MRGEERAIASVAILLVTSQVIPLAGPLLVRAFVDDARSGTGVARLLALAGGYLGVALVSQGLSVATTWAGTGLAWRVCDRIRADVAAHLLTLDYAWLSRRPPGELIQRADDDITAMSEFYSQVVLQVVAGALLLIGVVVIVWAQSWLTGAVLAGFVLVAGVIMQRAQSASVPSGVADRRATAELMGTIEERLSGVEDLRANGGGMHGMRRFHEVSADAYRIKIRAERAAGLGLTIVYVTFGLGTASLLATGTWLYRHGRVTLGTLFLLFQAMQLVRISLQNIADQLRSVQRAGGGASRVRELLSLHTAMAYGTRTDPLPRPAEVRFDRVSFAYEDGPDVLASVDLHVPAGEVLGVVGRTGSGKTTIARLLARLYDPGGGTVTVGGADLRQLAAQTLRANVAFVTQDVQLFSASVRDNLTMFSAEADDDALIGALEALDLAGWFRRLPGGLDTVIGPGGVGLSAGEAQLLAFGRVLLTDPAVVVLDEASSRLDPSTEARIDRAIGHLLVGRTGVVIAHRLRTLARADRVAVIEGGRVVETGARSDLESDPASRYSLLLDAEEGLVA